jgi:protein-S-isoprenylcysteine O-methyltransferase Ste14
VTSGSASGGPFALLFAVMGGLTFVVSLAYGAWAYAVAFAMPARPSTLNALGAVAANALLFGGFALHHSLFARTGVKRLVSTVVSPRLERSVYVWTASVLFILVCAWWLPVPGVAWQVDWPWAAALAALQLAGVAIALRASAQLDVLSLAGVRQTWTDTAGAAPELIRTGLYGLVRHPIYFGWVLMVWPTPRMTGTRLAFAVLSTLYLALAVPFEERSLRREFGPLYERYCQQVRWRMVPGLY